MFAKEKVLDDIARFAGGSVTLISSLRQQIKDDIKTRIDEYAQNMDLVPREDFEYLEKQVQALLEKQKTLEKKVKALEKKPAQKEQPSKTVKSTKKSKSAKKTTKAEKKKV